MVIGVVVFNKETVCYQRSPILRRVVRSEARVMSVKWRCMPRARALISAFDNPSGAAATTEVVT